MIEVVSIKGDDFAATATRDDKAIQVLLTGNADYAAIEPLEKVLQRLHAEARKSAVTEAIVDLRELEFMNSSCFKTVVSWITAIQELDAGQQYKVTFVSNPNMHWQKRSLHSLQCFAIDLIRITVQ